MFIGPCISDSWRIEDQLDVTCYYTYCVYIRNVHQISVGDTIQEHDLAERRDMHGGERSRRGGEEGIGAE